MAANTTPVFPLTAKVGAGIALLAANTAKDGTGTVQVNYSTATVAAGGNGDRIDKLIFKPVGTNVATLARIFLNNGTDKTLAVNNQFIKDVTLPAISNSEVVAQVQVEVPVDIVIPAGYTINWCLATAVAAGWQMTTIGGAL